MTAGHGSRRLQREDAAVAALLSEPSIAEAARKAGVSESTLLRWLAEPAFKARYRDARRQVLEHAVSALQQATSDAVETLRRNLKSGVPAAEISAAKAILDQSFRGLETLDLADEVAALKRQMVKQVEGEPRGGAA